jgi:hypothetical protein
MAAFLVSLLLPRSIVSGRLIGMPAKNPAPEWFEIEAVSPAGDPENETHILRMRLNGAYQVRAFLSANGVDEKRIAFAIEEIGPLNR